VVVVSQRDGLHVSIHPHTHTWFFQGCVRRVLLLYLHHVTNNDISSNACPSTSQLDRTYSILQASDSRQSLLVRRPCMHMLRSDTVDRRCSQGWARWYRDCHGVDLGGGVAPCCLGHPCMLEVCLRVPMYWSIESLHGGFSVFRAPSSYSRVLVDPRSRYDQTLLKELFNPCIQYCSPHE
jgi:hypothetical protein